MSKILIESYNRLLTDLVRLSGCAIGIPDNNDLEWLLVEGPLLDKAVLRLIESDNFISDEEVTTLFEKAPWLTKMALEFFESHNSRTKEIPCRKAGDLLKYLRQALLFCYKAEFEPTFDQKEAVMASFLDCERGIEAFDAWLTTTSQTPLFREATRLISRVIGKINWLEITPMHGPGAVFPPCDPCNKSDFNVIYPSIEQFYPFTEYFCGIPSFWDDVVARGQDRLEYGTEQIVARMVCVPKDSRGPRLICVHPKEAVWIQQGQRLLLEDAISRSPLTRGRINFSDQRVNGNLALEASIDRSYCTIDLKDASDSISRALVRTLFGSASKYLECCRATHIELLDGSVRPLLKMFPMGNASTFPVESLVFWACVRAGIRCYYGENCDNVYVFGDDIIIPTKYYEGAMSALSRFGFRPNYDKCYHRGFFRESCGVDAYNGINNTPLRIRVSNDVTVSSLASICDLAKRLRLGGYQECSSYLYTRVRKRIEKLSKHRLSLYLNNNPDAQGLFEYVDCDFAHLMLMEKLRFSKYTHTWMSRSILLRSAVTRGKDSWWNLQDSLLKLARCASDYSERAMEYKVPNLVRPTLGWTPISMR